MAPRSLELEGRVARSLRGAARKVAHAALVGAVGPAVLALGALALGSLLPSGTAMVVVVSWLIGWGAFPVLALASALLGRPWSMGHSSVRADARGLSITGEARAVRIERGRIAGAMIVTRGTHEELEVTTVDGQVFTVRLPSELLGNQLLDVLGYGASGRRVAVALGSSHDALTSGCGGLFLGFLATMFAVCGAAMLDAATDLSAEHGLALLGVTFVLASVLAARALQGTRAVVGSDGVRVEGPFRTRFVPYSAIEAVHLSSSGLMLVLGGERPSRLALSGEWGAREQALADRIQEAMKAAEAAEVEPRGAAMLDRGGRTLDAWREALRGAATGGSGYRRADWTADALLDVAKDADAPVERRIGAALAVAATGDTSALTRLRIATEGLASDHLRIAMERAVDGEIEEQQIEEAVREAEVRRA